MGGQVPERVLSEQGVYAFCRVILVPPEIRIAILAKGIFEHEGLTHASVILVNA
jgi:hypothetical protein